MPNDFLLENICINTLRLFFHQLRDMCNILFESIKQRIPFYSLSLLPGI